MACDVCAGGDGGRAPCAGSAEGLQHVVELVEAMRRVLEVLEAVRQVMEVLEVIARHARSGGEHTTCAVGAGGCGGTCVP